MNHNGTKIANIRELGKNEADNEKFENTTNYRYVKKSKYVYFSGNPNITVHFCLNTFY